MEPENGLEAARHVSIENGVITSFSEEPQRTDRVIDAIGHVMAHGLSRIDAIAPSDGINVMGYVAPKQ